MLIAPWSTMVKYDCTTDAGLRAALADTNVPMIGRRFGSLHASLVARYLDSRTAVRLLRKTAKRCSTPGALRLWTFDCYNEQQANELASEVDRNAVIVVRVHWSLQSCDLPPPLDGYFRNCESICLVGFPRYLEAAVVDAGTGSSIRFMPQGNALTARDGWAAVFAEAPAAPQGVTRQFRLRVNDVSRTFFSTFEDGRHGSSNFCALDDGDSSDDDDGGAPDPPADVRLDWLPDLPASRFRVETRGDDRAAFVFDRSLARGMAAEDAIMSPRTVFGTLAVLVFPAGRTEETRGRVGVFLRLMVYDEQGDARSRHFDVAVDGRRVGTISNSFGMNRELAGLGVGLSEELFPRSRPGGQIVVEITERPATSGLCDWICGACGKLHQDPTQPPEFFHGDLLGHRCNACRAPLNLSIQALHSTHRGF